MSGEQLIDFGTTKTLEANGASIANAAIGQADDAYYDIVDDGGGRPDGRFLLTFAAGTAFTEGGVIMLLARPVDWDGDTSADAEAPETGRPAVRIGNGTVNNVTTTQYLEIVGYDLPKRAYYYLYNVNTGQTISAGWTLKVKPQTLKVAA